MGRRNEPASTGTQSRRRTRWQCTRSSLTVNENFLHSRRKNSRAELNHAAVFTLAASIAFLHEDREDGRVEHPLLERFVHDRTPEFQGVDRRTEAEDSLVGESELTRCSEHNRLREGELRAIGISELHTSKEKKK